MLALAAAAYAAEGEPETISTEPSGFVERFYQWDKLKAGSKEIDRLLAPPSDIVPAFIDPPPYNGFAPPTTFVGPRPIALGRPSRGKVPLDQADMKPWIGLGDAHYWIMTPLPERGSLGPVCWYEDWMTQRCAFGERW